jgi:Domain of unknown function (DUF4185)
MQAKAHMRRARPRRIACALVMVVFSLPVPPWCSARAPEAPSPEVRVETVKDLGAIHPPPGIRGRDGGYSARYDGESIWVYGDTLYDGKGGMVSNSWSRTGDLDAGDGIDGFKASAGAGGAPAALLPFTDKERAFNRNHLTEECKKPPCGSRWALWPGALVPDPVRNRLLVFYEKIRVKSGFLNFETAGHSVAVWQAKGSPATRPVFNREKNHPTLMFGAGEPGFGSAAIVSGSQLFIFGCDLEGGGKPCRLARVPLDRVLDRTAWLFFTEDSRWQKEIDNSAPVFAGNDIMSVSFNPYLGRYLAVYSRPLGRAVMFRTAPAPEGPWSAPLYAFDALAPANETGWIYDAQEHPAYARDGGRRIFITYSRQTGPDSFEMRLVSLKLVKIHTP